MSFDTILGYLTVAASTAIGGFIVFVVLDLAAAILLAVRKGNFNWQRLPEFLGTQFATKEFLGMISLGVAAGTTALGSTLVHGGLTEAALQGVAQIALAAMTAGAAAMAGAVLKDTYSKITELLGGPGAPPEPIATPVPVTLVVNPQIPPASGG